jgi:hypothetical protein
VAIAAALLSCGPKPLPAPPFAAQPTKALSEVPYPPPPAHVEYVPPAPKDVEAVWLDGEWIWQGRRWAWKRGRWVTPPKNAYYTPWTTARDAAGTLYVAQGAWRDKFGYPVGDPPALALATTPPVAVVDPSGAQIPFSLVREGQQPTFDASATATAIPNATSSGTPQQVPDSGGLFDGGLDGELPDVEIGDALTPPDVIPLSPDARP